MAAASSSENDEVDDLFSRFMTEVARTSILSYLIVVMSVLFDHFVSYICASSFRNI